MSDDASIATSVGTEESMQSMQIGDVEDDFDSDNYFTTQDNAKSFRGTLPFCDSLDSESDAPNHLLECSELEEACFAPDPEAAYVEVTLEADGMY